MFMFVKPVHPLKADIPIYITSSFIVKSLNFVQPLNACLPMLVPNTSFPLIITVSNSVQSKNASSSILLTLAGVSMLFNLLHFANALY